MSELSTRPNIGKIVEKQLNEVGIENVNQLVDIGSKQAWVRIKDIDNTVCINRLYALEGAIQGIGWHHLSKAVKDELKEFYNNNR